MSRALTFATMLVLFVSVNTVQATVVSGNIHVLLDDVADFEDGIHSAIAMFSYDDTTIVGNMAPLTSFMWSGAGATIDMDTADTVNAASAFFSGGTLTGLGVDLVSNGNADFLNINSAGTLDFSFSSGPFGDGIYTLGPKTTDIVSYNVDANLVDNNTDHDFGPPDQSGFYDNIGMFSYDRNVVLNNMSPLTMFMWDGGLVTLDLDAVDPLGVNAAYAQLSGGNLVGVELDINDSISAHVLMLHSDGTLHFSASSGAFGDGTYTVESKVVVERAIPEPVAAGMLLLGIIVTGLRIGVTRYRHIA